ncbi:hypothetical protein ABZ865_25915 [Streptomyces sp. NPDC047085]|uniref:hypothetical protein n=1 Tax=Streptomyces sp. NPDC047085 TaxID=3155140 RepID=UPI0033DDA530
MPNRNAPLRREIRMQIPRPRSHARRSQDTNHQVDRPSKSERRYSLINTVSTAGATLMSVAALVVSLAAYYDQWSGEQENTLKDAAHVNWYFLYTDSQAPSHLVVENRSFQPAYNAVVNIEDSRGKNLQNFQIGVLTPCSKVTLELGKHGKDVRIDQKIEMFYRDPVGREWREGYLGIPVETSRKVYFAPESARDVVFQWGLEQDWKDLDACG